MRMTVISTPTKVLLDGVPCRLWEGITNRAVRVRVYIAAVEVEDPVEGDAFARELTERAEPGIAYLVVP